MAGDWIKFEVITSDKPEVWAIAQALGIDPDAVVGKLLRVWAWFDQYTEDGNAPSVTKLLLDRNVGVPKFCEVVTSVGWMLDVDGFLSLPHFDRHNGETAKTRALTAKRVAKHKAKNANGTGVTFALPKEEKRREDNNNKTKKGDKPPSTAFVKPTLSDLIDAFNARVPDALAEAHAFLDYYESNGWKVGKNSMKSWQATVRRWIAQRNKTPDNQKSKAGKTLEHLDDRSWADN